MATLNSPRPQSPIAPKFYMGAFSTKKQRGTPRDQPPPRPPAKSTSSIRRFFPSKDREQTQRASERARVVSFRASDDSLLCQLYDETSSELYFDQCFIIESKLGAGSFGEVFKVKSKEDGRCYAVKRSRERFRGEIDRRRKLEEVAKHEQLPKHSNCIQFVRAWEEKRHLYIQTELCEMSLSNYGEIQHDIPEALIWNYLVDLLQAVNHLHNHDLIHLDIKPANIFVSREGVCKLGDFGLVYDLKKNDSSDVMEGDPKYLAPELLNGKFTKAADIFSLGITILELACDLDLPSEGDLWHQLRLGDIPASLLSNISADLRSVIKLMMSPSFVSRPSADSLLSLPVVANVSNTRCRELRMNAVFERLKEALRRFTGYVGMFWTLLTFPLFRLYQQAIAKSQAAAAARNTSTSSANKRHPSEWDCSFSDDDPLNESAFLRDDTFGTDIHESSFVEHNDRISNSTPASKGSADRALTPRVLPKHDWDSYRASPSDSSLFVSPSQGANQTPRCSGGSASARSKKDHGMMMIGPKNLTKVFNELVDEERGEGNVSLVKGS